MQEDAEKSIHETEENHALRVYVRAVLSTKCLGHIVWNILPKHPTLTHSV
jgi:hypothetical protein